MTARIHDYQTTGGDVVRRVFYGAMCAVLILSVAGCSKPRPVAVPTPEPPVVEPPPPPPPPPPPVVVPPPPPPPTEDEIFARKSLADLNAERPLANVFFAYDSADLSADERATLQKDYQWLTRWPSVRITVEGHCDSRGTAEYNLGLGDRRAAAVKDYLVALGLAADRVMAVSKGEEEPVCQEEVESCWKQNRRGHFIITAK